MKDQTYTFKTFGYDELSEEAKQKAFEEMEYINIDDEWWFNILEQKAQEWREKYGISFHPRAVSYDFDVERFLFWMEQPNLGIWVEDAARLLQALSHDNEYARLAKEKVLIPYFRSVHLGHGTFDTVLCLEDNREEAVTDLPFDEVNWFGDIVRDLLDAIEGEWQKLISEEQVIDSIKSNELKFFEDGNPTRVIVAL